MDLTIIEEGGQIKITDNVDKRYSSKGHRSQEFPFKKVVMCPYCENPCLVVPLGVEAVNTTLLIITLRMVIIFESAKLN